MAEISISFNFSRGNETHSEEEDFDVDGSMLLCIDEHAEALLTDLNDGLGDDEESWEFDEHEVDSFDDDFGDPSNFKGLDEYGEFVEKCENYGESYKLRYDDLGVDFEFDNEYNGCWDSDEDFVQNLIEDCYDFTVPACVHVDWERTARDVMMDYSSYDGNEGTHIFRN